MILSVWVQGTPRHQPRPRAFARRMPNGQVIARVYDDGTAEGWKSAIAVACKGKFIGPVDGPVMVQLAFVFPRPKGHYRTGKRSAEIKPGVPWFHTGRPDIDNLSKAVMDALTNLGLWRDDTQVAQLTATKQWSNDPTKIGCQIDVESLTEGWDRPSAVEANEEMLI